MNPIMLRLQTSATSHVSVSETCAGQLAEVSEVELLSFFCLEAEFAGITVEPKFRIPCGKLWQRLDLRR